MKIIIINGPNLNLLGIREQSIYGNQSFESFYLELKDRYPKANLEYFQSNHEGAIIDKIHEVGFSYDGVILNAGGLSHTSISLADAVAAIKTPVIELHISNTFKRESFRHHSYLSCVCAGVMVGMGLFGYQMALEYFLKKKKAKF